MNNKLICPFCEYELQENRTTNLCCPICGLVAPTKLWQALTQAKQGLEIATKALEWLGNNRLAENPVRAEQLRRYARNTLEKINHDNSEKANSIEHKEMQAD